jgi:hemerythrin-like metal-binding protein
MKTGMAGLERGCEVLMDLIGQGTSRMGMQPLLEIVFNQLEKLPELKIVRRGALLISNSRGELVRVASCGFSDERAAYCERVSLDRCGCGQVATSGHAACLTCKGDSEVKSDCSSHFGLHFILPLLDEGKTIGVMPIYFEPSHTPSEAETHFMDALAKILSSVVSRRLMEEALEIRELKLEEKQAEVIRKLGAASEYRDNETGMHVMRMSHIAGAISKAMGLSADEREKIVMAAPMHDVGKIGIPDAVLLKPGKLDDIEFKAMTLHTNIGADLLDGDDELMRLACEIAMTHHEKWNGTGYPIGLKGEKIPLAGRICAVADVFDALTSRRPYKEPWSIDKAIEYIQGESDKSFDPKVVECFEKAMPEILRIRELYRDSIIDPRDVLTLPPLVPRNGAWIEWDKSIEVGIGVIDAHHHYLVDLTNDLYAAINERQGSREIGRVLKALERYAAVHFHEEEKMMRHCGYEEADKHAVMHYFFSNKIREFWADFHASPLTMGFEMVYFLRNWLINHIKKEDIKLHSLLG